MQNRIWIEELVKAPTEEIRRKYAEHLNELEDMWELRARRAEQNYELLQKKYMSCTEMLCAIYQIHWQKFSDELQNKIVDIIRGA